MRTVRQQVASSSIDEFMFQTDESAPGFIVDAFTDWLSTYIADGATFTDGQILQYGFMFLNCRIHERVLQLLAPDFQGMPIQWVANLRPCFETIADHKYIPETFSLSPDVPTLGNTAIVGKRFNEKPMFASRMPLAEANPNDSGWFLGSPHHDIDNNDPNRLKLVSLYEAIMAAPQILPFLSLPVGCQVVFSSDTPVVLRDDQELKIPAGSYLDQYLKAR